MPGVKVVHQDLPREDATAAEIQTFINNTLGNNGKLISVTFCEGPNDGLQRIIIIFTL